MRPVAVAAMVGFLSIALVACGDDDSGAPEQTVATVPPMAGIEFDSGVLIDNSEHVLVTSDDPAAAATALTAAGERFMGVNLRGEEVDLESDDYDDSDEESYTPNYVAPVKHRPEGVMLYVDCQGYISPEMSATFHRILDEELVKQGVRVATVTPFTYPDDELD